MDAPLHVQRVLDRLEGVDRNGTGWKARCPAHDDANPSLSIALGDDDRILVSCHAGCETSAVVKAIGLEMRDLFAPTATTSARSQARGKSPRVFATFADARTAACPRGHKFVKSWTYKDANGESVLDVCRFEPATPSPDGKKPEKTFRPISRAGSGFVIKDPDGPLPLYRLPELLAAPIESFIYVTEGEKAADAIAELDLAVTTTAHGSKSPSKTDLTPLAGRLVVIVPDNDAAGYKYAAKLASLLYALTPPAVVRLALLPGLPEKGDAVEFVSARRGEAKTDEAIRAEIEELARSTAPVEPKTPSSPDEASDGPGRRPRTDTGNAERLADRHRSELRYVHVWKKPLVWDGMRWKVDDLGRAMAFTKDVARSILDEAAAATGEARDDLVAFARSSESAARRAAMLNLVSSEDGIPILHSSLDVDPMLLNVLNGTIDLRTGELREHRQEDLLTCLAPVKHDPAADAPMFRRFLERVQPLEEMRAFLQRAVGMTLSGDVFDQVLLFLYGLGANGKTVFLRVIQAMLGLDYAHQAPTELLVAKQNRGHPTELASLFRKRFVVCTEIASGLRLDEQLVKQLTGGDLITARRMREDFWTFEPTHKLWLAGNHKPIIRGTDEAMWRRIRLVPWPVTIPIDDRDPDLFEKLTQELPGILNWAIDGCLLWKRDGLNPPPTVLGATAEYREEQDALAEFLASECVIQKNAKVSAKDLYAAYQRWCEKAGEEPLKQRTFGTRLTERGLNKTKISVVVYLGIGLKSDATP